MYWLHLFSGCNRPNFLAILQWSKPNFYVLILHKRHNNRFLIEQSQEEQKSSAHFGIKMYLDELSKSTWVVVAHRLCVAERFQKRIRCNMHVSQSHATRYAVKSPALVVDAKTYLVLVNWNSVQIYKTSSPHSTLRSATFSAPTVVPPLRSWRAYGQTRVSSIQQTFGGPESRVSEASDKVMLTSCTLKVRNAQNEYILESLRFHFSFLEGQLTQRPCWLTALPDALPNSQPTASRAHSTQNRSFRRRSS